MGEPVRQLHPFRPFSFAKWHGRTAPERDWMIQGVALKKTVCLFSGIGGIGKSLLMQQLMTSCALSKAWLGRDVLACRSFGLFAEDPQDEMHRRQDGISRHYGIAHGDLDDATAVSLDEVDDPILFRVNQRDSTGTPTPLFRQIEAYILDTGCQLAILDNVGCCFGGNANYPEQVRPFLQVANNLARKMDGLVVLIQHPSATGEQDGNAQAGARTWRNTVRSQLILQLPKEDQADEPSDERILRIGKNNYGRRTPPLRITWNDGVFEPIVLSQAQGGALNMVEEIELRSKIASSMRRGIERGERYSLAEKANNNVAKMLLGSDASWKRYTKDEIRKACDAMVVSGKLTVVEVKSGSHPVLLVRPTDARYPGERAKDDG